MGTFFLTEAGRIARQRERQALFGDDLVNELANHRVLAGADEIEVFAFNLVHHGIHLGETHHATNDFAAHHERRDAVSEASINHEVAGVSDDGRMQACDVAHEVIEAITRHAMGRIQIQAIELGHDVGMVWHLKIGHHRLAKAFLLHVKGVVLPHRHFRCDNVGDGIHHFGQLLHKRALLLAEAFQLLGIGLHEFLHLVGLLDFLVLEQDADFLGDGVALRAEVVGALLAIAVLGVQVDGLVDEGQLAVLEFLLDVFPDHVGVFD